MPLNAIELKAVTKRFKNITAVDSVDMQINQGQYVALLGPNGAGKTTLVEMIEGIQPHDSGEIFVLGKNWKDDKHYLRKIMGIALQETRFTDKVTVRETINLFASFYEISKTRADEILKRVGLAEKRNSYVVNLSGGQRQKLAIAVALTNNPKILLLDEPTTGLDPYSRREVWGIISELKDNNTTMILTTHYMEEAEYLCDRIIIINNGKFLADGTLNELQNKFSDGDVIEFTLTGNGKSGELDNLDKMISLKWDEEKDKGIIVTSDSVATLNHLLKLDREHVIDIKQVTSRKVTLDDLFISMTGKHLDE
ncbi:MAG: ABC transporter ATP-binding protein [Nitrospirae bacterium]|nr:ABC transporter ATP-binding protein [Nitrospirota bacterium]